MGMSAGAGAGRRARRRAQRRIWLFAVLAMTVWTGFVALVASAVAYEAVSESVTAYSSWLDSADLVAFTGVLGALAAATSLRRRGAGVGQLALLVPVLVVLPQVVLFGLVVWGLDLAADGTQFPVSLGESWLPALVGSGGRLAVLGVLAVVLGALAARGTPGWPYLVAALLPLAVALRYDGSPPYNASGPLSTARLATDVLLVGEAMTVVPLIGAGCQPFATGLCGQEVGVPTALGYLAAVLVGATVVGAVVGVVLGAAVGWVVRRVAARRGGSARGPDVD